MPGFVYILKSLKSGYYYVGSSENVDNRLAYHNSGRVKSTRNKGPWAICFCQEYPEIKIAKMVEHRLKKLKSKKIIEQIIENKIIKIEV